MLQCFLTSPVLLTVILVIVQELDLNFRIKILMHGYQSAKTTKVSFHKNSSAYSTCVYSPLIPPTCSPPFMVTTNRSRLTSLHYASTHLYIYAPVHAQVNAHTCIHAYMHICTCTHKHLCTHVHKHTHTHTHIHTYMYKHSPTHPTTHTVIITQAS